MQINNRTQMITDSQFICIYQRPSAVTKAFSTGAALWFRGFI